MGLEQIFNDLTELDKSKFVYMDVSDGCIRLYGEHNIEFSLPSPYIKSIFKFIIDFKNILITYDAKLFFNTIRFLNLKINNPYLKLFDIKLIESYCSINKTKPLNLSEAKIRFSDIVKLDNWKEVNKIYKEIHFPLVSRVIPALESNKILVSQEIKRTSYEIEGQIQGRISCNVLDDSFLNPHSMNDELKSKIKPNGDNKSIFSFDYKHMEVAVLQWISKDEMLGTLINNDFYMNLYRLVYNKENSVRGRKVMKQIFLPLVYGAGENALSESTGINLSDISKIILVIKKRLDKLFGWIESLDTYNPVNVFGRKRVVEHKYQARNFIVQSAAATVCQHKLIQLSNIYNVMFYIHDEYVLQLPSKHYSDYVDDVLLILNKEEEFYPGLKLQSSYCKGL